MSYSSRVYRQRNPPAHEEGAKDPFFQPKLDVNEPGDKYEKEADNVADAVVNKSSADPVAQRKEISGIQRLSTPAEDEKLGTNDARMLKDKEIQEKPMDDAGPKKEEEKPGQKNKSTAQDPDLKKRKVIQNKEEQPKEKEKEKEKKPKPGAVQKKAEAGSSTASSQVAAGIDHSAGKGKSLPTKTQQEMSSSFGYDFSDVKIHNDLRSADMNKELHSQAFTHGKDIYFNQGKFNTENADGKKLLAHELTHVVQQTGGTKAGKSSGVQAYRPKKAFNFGRMDTPDLAEDTFNKKKDKKAKLWIEDIFIVFTGTALDSEGATMPTGTLVALYKINDATKAKPFMPLVISFPITGGKHTEMYTHAGDFTVTRIEGVGYSNTSNDTLVTPHDNPKEGPGNKYDVDLSSNMSFAIFFYKGEAIHNGALDIGSHGCVHVDWGGPSDTGNTEQLRQLNYHTVKGLTKVHVSYDQAILPALCCKIYDHKKKTKGTGSNPCNKVKAQDCP
jgi:hypothetical protein